MSWSPPYSIRHSARARNISLRVSPENGLEIVVPKRMKSVNADAILRKHQDWILQQSAALQLHTLTKIPPAQLSLKAIEEHWDISYLPPTSTRNRIKALTDERELIVYCDPENYKQCMTLIHRWLKQKAEKHLAPWLQEISTETGLTFNKVFIRQQKTLWGSCSPEKNISLNSKLLLLNPEYTHLIMIHELCHTVHLNHSKYFWQKVASFIPDYKELNTNLRKLQLPI